MLPRIFSGVRRGGWAQVLLAMFALAASFASNDARSLDSARYSTSVGQAKSKDMVSVAVAKLPPEGQQTLKLIKQGGPFPFAKDGTRFGNRERRLPQRQREYYREYTVPTPGSRFRGARRIIAGANGEFYYTDDHYDSFRRIIE
jgi:ribonuclease T1